MNKPYTIQLKPTIIYRNADGAIRTATWSEYSNSYTIFTGNRGGNLRRYKTEKAMDAAMAKIGYSRMGM